MSQRFSGIAGSLVGRLRSALAPARAFLLRPITERQAANRALLDTIHQEQASLARRLEEEQGATRSSLKQALGEQQALLRRMQELQADHEAVRRQVSILERLLLKPPRLEPRPDRTSGNAAVPLVSVVLPTFNRAAFVGEAIASVQSQHFTDWELIVVDDGSNDDTAAAVRPFLADTRIRYVRKDHGGGASARNHGIKLARGSLIAYLDSDNLWYPEFLAAAVDVLEKNPSTDLAYAAVVTDWHDVPGRVLWVPFDRDKLLSGNFIDTSVMVHRKCAVERYGGWDERLNRLCDWDLALRYTEHAEAQAIPVLGAFYRSCDDQRISLTEPHWPEHVDVQKSWYPPAGTARPRVLYALWHYPQLSESCVEAELRQMRRWGVHVEVWRETAPVSPYPSDVAVHSGSFADAVREARPDVVHVHWLGFAAQQARELAAAGRPVTIRPHGFEFTPELLRRMLQHSWVRAVYAFPHQVAAAGLADPRLRALPAAFDSELFKPYRRKDRTLVVRTAAALPSKDIPLFFELAKRLPGHRFVFAGVTCNQRESYVEELRAMHAAMRSPAEIAFDLPQGDAAALVAQAGLYLHTAKLPGSAGATPIGMPISIAEAMATGAHVLVPETAELVAYAGEAGSPYHGLEHAAQLISATAGWTEREWTSAWHRSVERAFGNFADALQLRPMFEDWSECARVEAAA